MTDVVLERQRLLNNLLRRTDGQRGGRCELLQTGPVAEAIVAAVSEGRRPGGLTAADIAGYQPLVREAAAHAWKR